MLRPSFYALALILSAPVLGQARGTVASISRAKVVANAELQFAKVDIDKDGKMSRNEFEKFLGTVTPARLAAQNTAAIILHMDTNKDGKVSLAEHRGATIEKFNKLDGNKDSILTADEVKAASSNIKK